MSVPEEEQNPMAPANTAALEDETVYRVMEPFSFDHNGRTFVMKKGDIVTADHPAGPADARSALFEPVTAQAAREAAQMRTQVSAVDMLEVATAAPGERRRMEIDSSVPEDAVPTSPRDSVPPGPSTPAPTGEPQPAPAPTPPPPPTPPAPAGEQQTDADAVETTEQRPGSGRRGRAVKDQPQA